ncbi:MAG: hypothetical protein MHPSP_002417, partial [Paramarteilia canceri]
FQNNKLILKNISKIPHIFETLAGSIRSSINVSIFSDSLIIYTTQANQNNDTLKKIK